MIENLELKKQSEKILGLIATALELFDEDDEMRSHLAKYICILCSGFLENSVSTLYLDFVKDETKSLPVRTYLSVALKGINNPNSEKLRAVAKNFKPQWETELNEFMQKEDRSTSVNYIIKDRHKIAHGQDSEITLARIKEHHLKSLEVISFIEKQCKAI